MGQRLSNISESEEQLKDFNQQRHFPSQSTYLLPPVITIEINPQNVYATPDSASLQIFPVLNREFVCSTSL